MAFVKTLGQSVNKAILGGVCTREELEDSIMEMRAKAGQCIKDAS